MGSAIRISPVPETVRPPETTPETAFILWRADAGDGTYRNPILFADYSDPDAVRVGDDYWMTSSSFCHVPGLPILHSRDLVNWSLVNHALPRLVPEAHFSAPRHGGGVWAPSIRHHAGRFHIYYPDPDFGLYVTTAVDPRAEWSEPVLVCGGRGLIDPCPLWTDDGQAYLVHGWARSRSGICNRLTLRRLSADGLRTLDEGVTVVEGADLPGWHTIEGPKLYRRGDYYYIFAPAGGVEQGYQAVFRSRQITGPYEPRIVLHQGRTPINGPHQGAWVDTPNGEHWFLHFQDRGPFGRIVHLQPVVWGADGWPTVGTAGPDGVGEPVLRHRKPAGGRAEAVVVPATSDEFNGPKLGHQWQWQANPKAEWAALRSGGGLRLNAVVSRTHSLWHTPNLLLQKFASPRFEATTQVKLAAGDVECDAGLVVFGYSYAWIGLRASAHGLRLVRASCLAAHEVGVEREDGSVPAVLGAPLFLRVAVDESAVCRFSYSYDGSAFTVLGEPFQATKSKWVGAKVGLFARSHASDAAVGGRLAEPFADFAWFRVAGA